MTSSQVKRLKDWRDRQNTLRMVEEFDTHTLEATGADYQRPTQPMTHGEADAHTASVFRLPLNEVRRKRKSLRWRLWHFVGVY